MLDQAKLVRDVQRLRDVELLEARRQNPAAGRRARAAVSIQGMIARGWTLDELEQAWHEGVGYIVNGRDRKPAAFNLYRA
jgi:hypothetical protein